MFAPCRPAGRSSRGSARLTRQTCAAGRWCWGGPLGKLPAVHPTSNPIARCNCRAGACGGTAGQQQGGGDQGAEARGGGCADHGWVRQPGACRRSARLRAPALSKTGPEQAAPEASQPAGGAPCLMTTNGQWHAVLPCTPLLGIPSRWNHLVCQPLLPLFRSHCRSQLPLPLLALPRVHLPRPRPHLPLRHAERRRGVLAWGAQQGAAMGR